MLADHLARRWGLGTFRRIPAARMATGRLMDQDLELIKPQTFMNRSGAALAPLRSLPGFDAASDLLILHDEVAIPLGTFRLRGAGSSGGHNGLKSIEGALRRQDYARLKIGVGPVPVGQRDLADFVLGNFSTDERATIDALLEPMAEAVECWVGEGIERAMNRFNAKKPSS